MYYYFSNWLPVWWSINFQCKKKFIYKSKPTEKKKNAYKLIKLIKLFMDSLMLRKFKIIRAKYNIIGPKQIKYKTRIE